MITEEVLQEVKKVFTPVKKPEGLELSFHKNGCDECEFLREDLEEYTGELLPDNAIRIICQEMSCLSAQGWRWVLPSFLTHCLTKDSTYDDLETEFLIYNLSPDLKFQKETIQRLSLLSSEQIQCLIHFLEWCSEHDHWGSYCHDEIRAGIAFLKSIMA